MVAVARPPSQLDDDALPVTTRPSRSRVSRTEVDCTGVLWQKRRFRDEKLREVAGTKSLS
jgi:hypothetical protein